MNKISIQSISSMNYFFLREVFQKNKVSKEISQEIESSRFYREKSDNLYLLVIEEISLFLRQVSQNELSEEIMSIISSELEEGDYMTDLPFITIRNLFNTAIQDILGYEDNDLLEKYISIADSVYKKINI